MVIAFGDLRDSRILGVYACGLANTIPLEWNAMSGATTPISGDSIRVHLEKILASPRFAQSGRLKRFLRFSVEEALAGRAEDLKAILWRWSLRQSRQPRSRLGPYRARRARRLRRATEGILRTEGPQRPHPHRHPKGAYSPIFQRVAPPARPWREHCAGHRRQRHSDRAAFAAWRHFRRRVPVPHEFVPKRLTSNAGLTTQPAISPDGKLLAYSSDRGGRRRSRNWVQPTTGEILCG
jgi:hypothetical protein